MTKPSGTPFLLFAFLQCFVLFVAIGVAGMGFGGLFGAQNKDQALMGERLLLGGALLTALAGLLLILSIVTGFALRAGASWAPWLAKVTAWIAAVEFPLGTAFAIYWFRRQRQ